MSQPQINPFVSALLGVLLSIPYICVMGILAMQVDAGRMGFSADLMNLPTGTEYPGSEWPALLGLLVVSLVFLMLVTRGRATWTARGRAALGFGFSVPLLAVATYGVFVTGPGFMMGLRALDMYEGPHSWVDRAGNSTTLHLVVALVIIWSISQWRQGGRVPAQTADPMSTFETGQPPADPATGYQVN